MKTEILTTAMLSAFSLFLLSLSSFAQWYPQASGTNHDLKGVYFNDKTTGWVVGDSGTILHTNDGGEYWEEQTSGTVNMLNSVYFIDSLQGWIAGEKINYMGGSILHTADGGNSWEELYYDSVYRLKDVFFIDHRTGWAAGHWNDLGMAQGAILNTTDGGKSWNVQVATCIPFRSIHFSDSVNGWIVSHRLIGGGSFWSEIFHTSDGGESWQEQLFSNELAPLNSVFFTDSLNGWAVGGGQGRGLSLSTILHTTDGGETWQEQCEWTPSYLFDVCFTDPANGWAVGIHPDYVRPTILHTANGGISWYMQAAGITSGMSSVCFTDPENGWVVGDNGTILHTNDGGDSDCPDYIDYTMQMQIDSFPTHYPNCTQLVWGAKIQGDNITNLNGLNTLTSIGGDLEIINTADLMSLAGLDKIDASSISNLFIRNNDSLSYCEVKSICDYLANPNGNIYIEYNATGCNSKEEVEEACDSASSIQAQHFLNKILIQPNPFSTSTTIEYDLKQPTTIQITFYNHLGKQLEVIQQTQSAGKQQVVWDAEGLPGGVYYCVLKINEGMQTMKMIKMK